jgi:ABC-type Fe3+ transport system permease subunit
MEPEPAGSERPEPNDAGSSLRSVLAGALAFLGSLFLGLALTFLVVRAISPEHPHPTEAYEGFGDAMMALFHFAFGAVLSLIASMIVAGIVAAHVARRGRRRGGRG